MFAMAGLPGNPFPYVPNDNTLKKNFSSTEKSRNRRIASAHKLFFSNSVLMSSSVMPIVRAESATLMMAADMEVQEIGYVPEYNPSNISGSASEYEGK